MGLERLRKPAGRPQAIPTTHSPKEKPRTLVRLRGWFICYSEPERLTRPEMPMAWRLPLFPRWLACSGLSRAGREILSDA